MGHFKKGMFTPKSLYLELGGFRVGSFPIDGIWIPGIPSKVSFMWNVFLNKFLTIDHLQSRGWNLTNRCVMCLREESVDHLFIHCAVGHKVWCLFLFHFNVLWSFPFYFCELILDWWIRDLDDLPSIIWSYLSEDARAYGMKGTQ